MGPKMAKKQDMGLPPQCILILSFAWLRPQGEPLATMSGMLVTPTYQNLPQAENLQLKGRKHYRGLEKWVGAALAEEAG